MRRRSWMDAGGHMAGRSTGPEARVLPSTASWKGSCGHSGIPWRPRSAYGDRNWRPSTTTWLAGRRRRASPSRPSTRTSSAAGTVPGQGPGSLATDSRRQPPGVQGHHDGRLSRMPGAAGGQAGTWWASASRSTCCLRRGSPTPITSWPVPNPCESNRSSLRRPLDHCPSWVMRSRYSRRVRAAASSSRRPPGVPGSRSQHESQGF